MKIGEIQKILNISKDAIRHYEKKGLLVNITRPNASNNYKNYDEKNIERLKDIIDMREMGFSIAQIKDILYKADNQLLSEEVGIEIAKAQIKKIDDKIQKLVLIKEKIIEVAKKECNYTL